MIQTHNKALHWIFTPLRYVKTSEFKRYDREKRVHSYESIPNRSGLHR